VQVAAKKKGDSKKGEAQVPEAMVPFLKELGEALKKVSPQRLKEAEKRVADLEKGGAPWTELFNLSPEKLQEMAKVGYEQFKSGSYPRSEKIFRGLTVVDPDNYYYHQMLGASFQRQEKYAEAILEYSIAVDLNREDAVSLTNRGESYLKMNLHPLASQDFETAIELDSDGTNRWANRARMLKEQIKIRGGKK
jgi:type III secretion system low calcium response chaperone LcrH/SycD